MKLPFAPMPSMRPPYELPGQSPQMFSRVGDERGSAIVETALSSTLLLAFIFGIMKICLAVYTYHFISDAAREGTRYAIVRGSSCQGFASACPATSAEVQSYVRGLAFPGINPSAMTVATSWPTTGTSCTPSSAPCNNPGNLVHVSVQYQFPLTIPFALSKTITMNSSSEMVISQ